MGSEVLLYGYGAVCLSMMAFNIIYNFVMKQNTRRLEKREARFANKVRRQLSRMKRGQDVEQAHLKYLLKRLLHINNLIAFDHVMEEYLKGEENPVVTRYCEKIRMVIFRLAVEYNERDKMQAAYFAWFLSRYMQKKQMPVNMIQDIMVSYMKKDSLYCRVNALEALYKFGSEESVVEAITLLDRGSSWLHEKILTDGLLTFRGNHELLIRLLWERLDSFSLRMQLSVLNYIRFKTGDYCGRMFEIMMDETKDKELRLSAIRYFGRYFYAPAKEPLLDFVRDKNLLNWEYASIAATALAEYHGNDVAEALMEAMHSPNWYVRYNAAASQEAQQLDYNDLLEVIGSHDRYAREMILYRLDARGIK